MNTFSMFSKLASTILLFLALSSAWGQETEPAAPPAVTVELQALIQELGPKLQDASGVTESLKEDLQKFDALYAKYGDQKTEEVARVLVIKAMVCLEFLKDPEAAKDIFRKLEADFAGTGIEERARAALASIEIQSSLNEGDTFPPFEVTDLDGKPLNLASYKGKVVLIDFWATWCGPCVRELPNVLEAYEAYHDKGFEIIGISLDKSRESLDAFAEKNNMTWPQFFDGQGWKNALAKRYGVQSIPATFLLDTNGVIIGSGLRGDQLKLAVAKALGEE